MKKENVVLWSRKKYGIRLTEKGHSNLRNLKVSVTFHITCVHNSFSSVWIAEWPPLGK